MRNDGGGTWCLLGGDDVGVIGVRGGEGGKSGGDEDNDACNYNCDDIFLIFTPDLHSRLWLQLMVFDCIDKVCDEALLSHCRCNYVDDGDDDDDDDNDETNSGDSGRSCSLFIESVSRCCGLLAPQAPPQSQSSSSSAAAACKPCQPVHDSAASSANRLFRRLVALFPVNR